ncbi:unnamed protein product [Rotaria socialis]|uniref:Uncharacterized protein n=1 Tax=Rotaria socialis TaxID=392032 RepID=A0A818PTP3_9BILA|nr:unnamed protein product [Rotaria socialis]CAF3626186.1 unnamed protein product [Rotaria socialis]CAF3742255.1 unnamed protein product [Rotaria socialis]CAF3764195.1 unnamed protein product [Rotaria socialis]CAF4471206.1 unnamed protein product [Rotaria socialis]
MSLIIPEKQNSNSLPDDVFSYNQNKFYEFVEHWYGNDLAQLFSFQAIRNGSHLLHTTVDDILSVLQYESEDIDKLKSFCCFQLPNNRFEVRLGVKLAINNFIELLNIKQEQEKRNDLLINVHHLALIHQYLLIKHNHKMKQFYHQCYH